MDLVYKLEEFLDLLLKIEKKMDEVNFMARLRNSFLKGLKIFSDVFARTRE